MKRFKGVLSIVIVSFFIQCSDLELGPPITSFSSFELCDIGNEANASDIELNLTGKIAAASLLEYRLFLIKEGDEMPPTIDDYKAVIRRSYHSFQPGDVINIKGTIPSSTMTDVNGNDIVENKRYASALMSLSNDEELASSSVQQNPDWFVLSQNDVVSDFSQQFDFNSGIGAGGLAIFDDQILMSSYNIVDELSSGENENHSIVRLDRFGKKLIIVAELPLLGGLAVNSSGEVFQSIIHKNKIVKVDNSLELPEVNTGDFTLRKPDGLFINSDDDMFIVGRNSSQVLEIDEAGNTSQFATIPYANPKGITGDDQGNLYISHNVKEGYISKVDADGNASLFAQIPTFVPDGYLIEYFMYLGYLQYHEGSIYVAGMSTDRIYKVSEDGSVEEFAGSGRRGLPKGDKRKADLNRPNGIVFSADGNTMYISGAEDTNPSHTQSSTPSRVWKIDLVE